MDHSGQGPFRGAFSELVFHAFFSPFVNDFAANMCQNGLPTWPLGGSRSHFFSLFLSRGTLGKEMAPRPAPRAHRIAPSDNFKAPTHFKTPSGSVRIPFLEQLPVCRSHFLGRALMHCFLGSARQKVERVGVYTLCLCIYIPMKMVGLGWASTCRKIAVAWSLLIESFGCLGIQHVLC